MKKTKKMMVAITIMMVAMFGGAVEALAANYEIPKGTPYYESSWNFGSGKSGIVGNKYTSTPGKIRINGYSYLGRTGEIISSNYKETAGMIEIPDPPEGAVKLFLHFCTGEYRNGWVDFDLMRQIE